MNEAEILELPVTEIGPGPLVRTERTDEAHAELLRPMLDEVPPVIVRETGTGWSLIDGQHRLSAAKLEGRETIRAVVVALDDAEALEAAVKANTSHGKALSLSERKAAAVKLIESTDWSDRRIAAACGLHRVTVGKHRPEDSGGRNRPRVGQDGKSYTAVADARARREADAEQPAAEPVKCIGGFDCNATADGDDGLCAWHRKQQNKASDGSSSPSDPGQDPAPVPGTPEQNDPTRDGGEVDAAPEGGGEPVPPPAPPAVLSDDWRTDLANAVYFRRHPVDLLRPALSDDDRFDLTELHTYLTAVLGTENP